MVNINSNLTSNLLSLYGYNYTSQSSSTLNTTSSSSESNTANDSASLSSLAQSLLSDSAKTTEESQTTTYYQMGSFGQIIEKYAMQTLRSLNETSGEGEADESSSSTAAQGGTSYAWNMAMSSMGQRQLTSGIMSLFEASSGEEREALKQKILDGMETSGTSSISSFLSASNTTSVSPWQSISKKLFGSSKTETSASNGLNGLVNLDGVELSSAQRNELNNLQLQALAVNNYTRLSGVISKINLSG